MRKDEGLLDKKTVVSMIDHAVLKPEDKDADVLRECEISVKYGVASVCVKPCHVALAREVLKGSKVKVSTVIGFPHGSTTTACKVYEATEAIESGAEELDMVINIGKLLEDDYAYVRDDIAGVVSVAHAKGAIVKVIIETALLDIDHKAQACKLAEEAGADFVKTSTGFNGRGATLEDICIMRGAVGTNMKLKASGGIKTFEQAIQFVNAGCERLGTSSTAAIANEVG